MAEKLPLPVVTVPPIAIPPGPVVARTTLPPLVVIVPALELVNVVPIVLVNAPPFVTTGPSITTAPRVAVPIGVVVVELIVTD